MIGDKAVALWQQAAAAGSAGLIRKLVPYADDIAKWFVSQAGSVGLVFVQFLLTVVTGRSDVRAAANMRRRAVHRFGRRLAGVHGENAVTLAGRRSAAWRSASASRRWCSRCSAASAWRSPACPSPGC